MIDTSEFRHDLPENLGILLINLGTPNDPSVRSVRRYLAEFLSDRRVVEVARIPWWLLLHGVILRTRPRHSARAYQTIWTPEGSPLAVISQQQVNDLQQIFNQEMPGLVKIALAMRYGEPSIAKTLNNLNKFNLRRLLIFPLYPQYSSATTGTVFEAVTRELSKWRWIPEIRFIQQYYDNPGYINALSASILNHWKNHEKPERLLFSFHGIPQQAFLRGDPYYCQCHKTARLVAEKLSLGQEKWAVAFQSRLGKAAWLAPYTEPLLRAWAQDGIRSVHVIAPGFAADCLETLLELAQENRHSFLAAGGREYSYIPCLNNNSNHLMMLIELIKLHASGWPELMGLAVTPQELTERALRAQKLGATQ